MRHIEIARGGILYVATATGKERPVRFELAYYALMPEVRSSPWKDPQWLGEARGTLPLIAYARNKASRESLDEETLQRG
jgi:hypothetical protein